MSNMYSYNYDWHWPGVVCTAHPICIGKKKHHTTWKVNRKKMKSFHSFKVHSEMFGSRALFMPDPSTFTGLIAKREDFVNQYGVKLSEDKGFHFTMPNKNLWTGVEAEGCEIHKDEAFAIATADCYTVVISHRDGFMMAFHAGLKSVVDFNNIVHGSSPREFFSVVDSAFEVIKEKGLKIDELKISVHCGIGWENFMYKYSDEVHGENNKILTRHLRKHIHKSISPTKHPVSGENIIENGHINLLKIIYFQLQKHGVKKKSILHDGIDTADVSNSYVSHSQGTSVNKKTGKVMRNLVMVWHLLTPLYELKKGVY